MVCIALVRINCIGIDRDCWIIRELMNLIYFFEGKLISIRHVQKVCVDFKWSWFNFEGLDNLWVDLLSLDSNHLTAEKCHHDGLELIQRGESEILSSIDNAQNINEQLLEPVSLSLAFGDHPGIVLECIGIGHQSRASLNVLQIVNDLLSEQELLSFISTLSIDHIGQLLFTLPNII